MSTGRLYDGRTVGEPFVDAAPTCADIVELVAPIHTCTGSPTVNLPNGTEVTLNCGRDWSADPILVRELDPHYAGPLNEYCPHHYGCEQTMSPGQYSCSGDCEVEPVHTTCMGAPFSCRPPSDTTSADYNYTRCFDATDADSCASMQDDDYSALLGCVGTSTVRTNA